MIAAVFILGILTIDLASANHPQKAGYRFSQFLEELASHFPITSVDILDDTITSADIADGTITADDLAPGVGDFTTQTCISGKFMTGINADGTIVCSFVLPVCGNAIVDGSESCDDGNAIDDGNGCSSTCQFNNVCGNSIVESLVEVCDDGNTADGDGCSATCTSNESCGNSIVDSTVGEACDDGNAIDDGNGCSSTCQFNNLCGNSIVEVIVEACDSGGIATPTCDVDCTIPVCGDGTVNNPAGEVCDDGNIVSFDGCSPACQVESVDDIGGNEFTAEPFPQITPNGFTKSGTINFAGDEDWFSFTIFSTKLIRMQTALTSPGMDTFLTLIDTNGITVLDTNDDFIGLGFASRIDATLGAGTYFVVVRHFAIDVSGESYTLTITDVTPILLPEPNKLIDN